MTISATVAEVAATMEGEREAARRIADRFLDEPGRDPDSDESVLARQFQRVLEKLEGFEFGGGAWREGTKGCDDCIDGGRRGLVCTMNCSGARWRSPPAPARQLVGAR